MAITLIRHRLKDAYGDGIEETYEVVGEPVSLPDAEALAAADPYQFQWWALDRLKARRARTRRAAAAPDQPDVQAGPEGASQGDHTAAIGLRLDNDQAEMKAKLKQRRARRSLKAARENTTP